MTSTYYFSEGTLIFSSSETYGSEYLCLMYIKYTFIFTFIFIFTLQKEDIKFFATRYGDDIATEVFWKLFCRII